MLKVVSYRFSISGEWGYSYYAGTTPLGGTNCQAGTASMVRIIGEDLVWYSSRG